MLCLEWASRGASLEAWSAWLARCGQIRSANSRTSALPQPRRNCIRKDRNHNQIKFPDQSHTIWHLQRARSPIRRLLAHHRIVNAKMRCANIWAKNFASDAHAKRRPERGYFKCANPSPSTAIKTSCKIHKAITSNETKERANRLWRI